MSDRPTTQQGEQSPSETLAVITAHEATKDSAALAASDRCGCFFCITIFSPSEIEELTEDGCAICPHCHIDSVIGDKSGYPITTEFLSAMHAYWFTEVKTQ